jgi:hypothetical protein
MAASFAFAGLRRFCSFSLDQCPRQRFKNPCGLTSSLTNPVRALGVLDQENHQKGNDRDAGVDHQLPSVTETKKAVR